MIDSWLSKTKIKKVLDKFVEKVFYNRISPNQITILGLILGLLSAFFIFLSGFLPWELLLVIISVILMSISFFFDTIDGTLARLKEPTKFGGILDIFCDRTVEIFIIIAIISTNPLNLMWPGIFSLGAIVLCITMFLIVGGAIAPEELGEIQKIIYYRKSLMERSETCIFLILIVILIPWRFLFLWIFATLVFITSILRLIDAYTIFKSDFKKIQEK
ncbi:MAG: CDP-alcohol phosphatidyltransferase family protein [Promethearchaeota archaeon]